MSPQKYLGIHTLTVSLALFSSSAYSAGFAIIENSGSGMGSAFAGASAIADDPSTIFFNPAGMALLENRSMVTTVGHAVLVSFELKDKGSSVNPALTGGSTAAAQATLTGSGDDGGTNAFIPNFYYVKPINENLRFGLGVNAPFGLEITYADDWVGRYQATNSELLSLNINPSLSWKANDRLALGAGVSAQYIKAVLGSKIDSGAACRSAASAANSGTLLAQCLNVYPQVGQSATDSNAEVSGDDVSFGFNVGLIFQPTDKTRLGLSYRSKIKHKVKGDVNFTLDNSLQNVATSATTNLQQTLGATNLADRPITASATVPAHISFSVAHKVNNKLELLTDITRTNWSSFDELRIVDTTGETVSVTPEKWKDVWRFSIGGKYKYNDKLTLRAGAAYDESPVPGPKLRTPRLPGNDRTWISFGANYKLNKKIDMDFGYAHLSIDDTPIDNTDENGYTVSGVYEASADIVSAQLNWKF